MDRGAEDLSLNRGEEDDDDHDDHEDTEKVNESDGVEAERLKAFNVSYMILLMSFGILFSYLSMIWGICLWVNVRIKEVYFLKKYIQGNFSLFY